MKDVVNSSAVKILISFILFFAVLVGCNFIYQLNDVRICEIPQSGICEKDTAIFVRNTKQLTLTATSLDIPEGTKLKLDLKDKGNPFQEKTINSTIVEVKNGMKNIQFSLKLERLPEGTYEAVIISENRDFKEIRKEFVVLGSQAEVEAKKIEFNVSTARLEKVKICAQPKEGIGCERDVISFGKKTPKLFVTAELKNNSSETKIKFIWRYVEGEAGKEIDIDSLSLETTENDNLISSSLSIPNKGWPTGTYEVVLSLATDNSPPIRREFYIQ